MVQSDKKAEIEAHTSMDIHHFLGKYIAKEIVQANDI